jgi:regulator of RNase E activity RraA
MGGVGGRLSKRQGVLGAIVDGAVRDVGDYRAIDYPVWSAGVTPLSGKWRVQAVEINGPVSICGVVVNPGDLVVADDSGVCFVPRAHVDKVLELTRQKVDFETEKCRQIADGWTVPEIMGAVSRRGP